MTEAQRDLLKMCQPEVTLQGWVGSGGARSVDNPHLVTAEQCVSLGYLEFVRDEDDFHQSVYRITPAGADALAKQH
jgi:hypothetical protein